MRRTAVSALSSVSFATLALAGLSSQALAQQVPAVTQPEAKNCATLPTEAEREACIEAQAQDAGPSGVVSDSPVESAEEAAVPNAQGSAQGDTIVVTGSRIRQNTYNSISPLQVITTENAQNVGAFDPAQILQRDESAAGTQIDSTFQGFVLNNGPGSQTVDLRGLGADRTLLLINGRRLAPAGVEGAPTSPSINLIPSSLVERYDLLLEGASSVYGSDAVAGVGNIILRKNFRGLELFTSGNLNGFGSGGNDVTASAVWGTRTDRAVFGIGAEFSRRDNIRFRDRPYLSDCDTHYEVTDNGDIRTIDLASNALVEARNPGISVSESACKVTGISGRIFIPFTRIGSVYFQEGEGNIPGLPNFSESNLFNGANVDADGDGIRDVDFQDVNTNGAFTGNNFIPPQKLYNVMAYGEYELGAITPFFEANYTRAEIFSEADSFQPQLFPYVPATNAFNPCRGPALGGVGCRGADNSINVPAGGSTLSAGTLALPVQPIVAIRGDRNNTDVTQEQMRLVGGVKGEMPFVGPSWTYEVAGVYSRSKGVSRRRGIREDKLALALGIDPTADFNGDGVVDNNGDGIADDYNANLPLGGFLGGPVLAPCDTSALANPDLAMSDLAAGCVPVNLFAPSVLGSPIGDFATAAERDYVFGVREFNTIYKQRLFSAYATGDIISLPAGELSAVLGVEYRKDEIDSRPDAVAASGLLIHFFADEGAKGSKEIAEAFGELEIPVLKDHGWGDFRMNASGRVTDDEYYGTNITYALKGGWRPLKPLLFKMSYGTSFRAPNLRENFLRAQTGFLTLTDPCAVPDEAFVNGAYDPTLETRDPQTLANCTREGRDPTRVGIDPEGLNANQTSSVEIESGGSLELEPERSNSFTTGVAFAETFGAGLNVSLGVNYYNITVRQSIIEPSSQFILNDCFLREDNTRSVFCDRITAGTTPSSRFLVSDVFAGFINLDQEKVRGIDLNGFIGKDVSLFGRVLDLGLNLRANHLIERSSKFVGDDGQEDSDDDQGEFGYPKWTGRATFTAEMDKRWLLTWQTRYIGPVEQDESGVDPLSDAFGNGPDGESTGFVSDTCTGGGSANGNVEGDGVFCRDVGYARRYFIHTASVRYRADKWEARVGVTNLFNKNPPQVDGSEVLARSNVPIGNGYDLDGREFFGSVKYRF